MHIVDSVLALKAVFEAHGHRADIYDGVGDGITLRVFPEGEPELLEASEDLRLSEDGSVTWGENGAHYHERGWSPEGLFNLVVSRMVNIYAQGAR